MTNTAPLSSCTVTTGAACLPPLFLVVMVLPEGIAGDGDDDADADADAASSVAAAALAGVGHWSAHSDAATAHCRRSTLAGRLLAWARRLPAGVVSMAEWM